jgi:hypothetical protein
LNTFYVKNGSDTKFSVANATGNTRVYGTLTVDNSVTANAGITVDNSVFNGDKISRASGNFEIETTTSGDIILDAAGENIIFNDGADERMNFSIANDAQELTTQGAFTIDVGGSDKAFTAEATGAINLTAENGDITLDASGDIILDADGDDWLFKDGTNEVLSVNNNGGTITLDVDTDDKLFYITGTDSDGDGGASLDVTALTIDFSDKGAATFADDVNVGANLTVTGDFQVDGSLTLGNATTDTITVNAIIADETLKLKRGSSTEDLGAEGFNLVFEKRTSTAAAGDDMGVITFQMNGATPADEDQIKATITANATDVANSSERSEIVFATASGTGATSNKFTISDEISAAVDLVSSSTNTIGQTDDYWSKAYITDMYGDLHGDVRDEVGASGFTVLEIGSDNPQNDPDGSESANYSVFYGRVVGPIEGNAESADFASTVETGSVATNADHYLTFVDTNHSTRTGSAVYTDADIKYNPSTDLLTLGGVFDITDTTDASNATGDTGALRVEGGASIAKKVYAGGGFFGALTGNVSGNVSGSAGSVAWTGVTTTPTTVSGYGITDIVSQFSEGTGISISAAGQISASLGEVEAGSASEVTVTEERTNSGTFYPVFATGATGTKALKMDDQATNGLSYVPSSSTLTATNFSGNASSANYADLAEKYLGDALYEPGTVLVFGGENEVTVTNTKGDRKVAGIVSTDPAYLMNNQLEGDNVVELALTGRVPCKVIGRVEKGDMLVTSAIPGYAIVNNDPKLGTVIGKAVGTKDDEGKGVVEVVVGRL